MNTIATRQLQSGQTLTIATGFSKKEYDAELNMEMGGLAQIVFAIDGKRVADMSYVFTCNSIPAGAPNWVKGCVRMNDNRLLCLNGDEVAAIDAYFAPYRAEAKQRQAEANIKRQALSKKARAYDNLMNEGGEGYNPYR